MGWLDKARITHEAKPDGSRETLATLTGNLGAAYFAWASKIAKTDPSRARELWGIGRAHEEVALGLDPTSPTRVVNLMLTLIKLELYGPALDVAAKYRGPKEETHAILHHVALAETLLGRFEDAIASASRAMAGHSDTAFMIAIDDDFAPLREKDEFRRALSEALGYDAWKAVQGMWGSR